MQQGKQFFLFFLRIDDDGTVFLQSMGYIRTLQQPVIYYNHIVRRINIGMNRNRLPADAVVSRNRRSHALRSVFRKTLYKFSCLERYVCQQKRRGLGSLSPSSVPSDFHCVFHIHASWFWFRIFPLRPNSRIRDRSGFCPGHMLWFRFNQSSHMHYAGPCGDPHKKRPPPQTVEALFSFLSHLRHTNICVLFYGRNPSASTCIPALVLQLRRDFPYILLVPLLSLRGSL